MAFLKMHTWMLDASPHSFLTSYNLHLQRGLPLSARPVKVSASWTHPPVPILQVPRTRGILSFPTPTRPS